MLDSALRSLLHTLPPEAAHARALDLLRLAALVPGGLAPLRRYAPPTDPVTVCGLRFDNRIGLAAGYDKDAVAIAGLSAMGFGHLELGTVTPRAQPGNDGTRIVRLRDHAALVNRLGFPGAGLDPFVANLRARPSTPTLLGANVGKNRDTPAEHASDDYVRALTAVAPHVDYVTLNLSSPNTAGLRALQHGDALTDLLATVVAARDAVRPGLPVWVKLSPDLPDPVPTVRRIEDAGCDALVLGNTTVSRPVPTEALGGLSGPPLAPLAIRLLERVAASTALPCIAVGGIDSAAEVHRRIDAGAALVQIYTALVYQGPGVLSELAGGPAR